MPKIDIIHYSPELAGQWNEFVRNSRNGTFLLQRDYMDYHSDRFADCSWMAYLNGKLRALLPANRTADNVLHSHQGLTYGGWILPKGHLDGGGLLDIFNTACGVWREIGLESLDYKPIPAIYSQSASEEDRYALFRLGAVQTGCGLSTAVNLSTGPELNQMQRRHLKNCAALDWEITEEQDVTLFMDLLTECLDQRHGVRPVHTAAELQLLHDRFPHNIRIFLLALRGEAKPAAGVCVYDTGIVAHAQYIATSQQGRELNLLTPLFVKLMSDLFAGRQWFDFGISTEDNGNVLNFGLLRQKCSYGGGGVIYPRYSLRL